MRTCCAVVVLLLASHARADVSVTVTTTPNGGNYTPKNVVALWIEDAGGTFIKTFDRFSAGRTSHLVAWVTAAGQGDADAVSGATRPNHVNPITATWNLRDRLGALVPDGTYTIRMELADSNASQASQNHQGTFTFTKGAAPQTQSGLSSGGFVNVSIDFQPVADTCNNGVVDTGEACDPSVAGSCPTACPAASDPCMTNELVGDAASCSAACVLQPIPDCVDGSGGDLSGSCSAGGTGGGYLLLGLAGLVLALRRRR